MIGTNFPVEGIEELAARLRNECVSIEGRLSSIRSTCQRDPTFSGTAAARYDEYLQIWDLSQRQLLESMQATSQILSQLAQNLRQTDSAVAQAFG